ncbi:MAG: hypothetical protein NTX66_01615 [Candidatus Falkowbacteria bacterium]|nr:hypothetical protein [Candidatus Falkowbacteria bacterium]
MDNFRDNKKILFIPGWLDSGELHGYKNSLDIWNKKIDLNQDFKADFIIAHSVGALAALYNWHIHKNFKIILLNPVLAKKDLGKRWLKSIIYEGTPCPPQRIKLFLSFIPALIKASRLFKVPVIILVKTIPPEQLAVIYGENDKYLYDQELINSFGENNFKIIKIKGAGHNYSPKIEAALISILTSV